MIDGENFKDHSYFDLHLVWHRLNEIVETNQDTLKSSYDIYDDVLAVRRLVRSLLNGYEKDAEA